MKDSEMQVYLSPQDDDEIDLLGIFNYLRVRWKFILLVTILGACLGVVASMWSRNLYASDILLQVDSYGNHQGRALGEMGALMDVFSPAEAEMELIQSRAIMAQVVKAQHLRFGAEPTSKADRFMRKEGRLDVDSLRFPRSAYEADLYPMARIIDSTHYEVTDNEGLKILEATVGEIAVAQYADDTVAVHVSAIYGDTNQTFILYEMPEQAAINMLKGSIGVSERGKLSGVFEVSMAHRYPDKLVAILNDIGNTYVRRNVEMRSEEARKALAFLNEQLPSVRAALDSAEKRLTDFRHENSTIDTRGETQAHFQKDLTLEGRLLELEQKKQEALRLFKSEHPSVQTIELQQQRLRREMAQQNKSAKALPKIQQEVIRLQEEVQVNSGLYTGLLNKIQELSVVQAGEVGNVRIVDFASYPLKPIKPRRKVIFLGFILGAFVFACGVLLVRRMLNSGVTSTSELEQATNIGVYGSIPLINGRVHNDVDNPYVMKNVNSSLSEAIRALKTALEFSLDDGNKKMLLVTGLTESVGKSFISTNLAYALSAKKKVLLIDLDLRRGHLLSRHEGICDVLMNKSTLDSSIHHVSENFDVLGTGNKVNNPAVMLESDAFKELLEQIKSHYDLVVLDTPPVMQCSDVLILERSIDYMLCVLKHNSHNMESIKNFISTIDRGLETPVPKAFVFNKCESSKNYGYYYGYNYSKKKK